MDVTWTGPARVRSQMLPAPCVAVVSLPTLASVVLATPRVSLALNVTSTGASAVVLLLLFLRSLEVGSVAAADRDLLLRAWASVASPTAVDAQARAGVKAAQRRKRVLALVASSPSAQNVLSAPSAPPPLLIRI